MKTTVWKKILDFELGGACASVLSVVALYHPTSKRRSSEFICNGMCRQSTSYRLAARLASRKHKEVILLFPPSEARREALVILLTKLLWLIGISSKSTKPSMPGGGYLLDIYILSWIQIC
jgi:hypothetical protein